MCPEWNLNTVYKGDIIPRPILFIEIGPTGAVADILGL